MESFLLPESNIDRLALIGMLQRMVVRLSDIALADVEQRCFQHKEHPKYLDHSVPVTYRLQIRTPPTWLIILAPAI